MLNRNDYLNSCCSMRSCIILVFDFLQNLIAYIYIYENVIVYIHGNKTIKFLMNNTGELLKLLF